MSCDVFGVVVAVLTPRAVVVVRNKMKSTRVCMHVCVRERYVSGFVLTDQSCCLIQMIVDWTDCSVCVCVCVVSAVGFCQATLAAAVSVCFCFLPQL